MLFHVGLYKAGFFFGAFISSCIFRPQLAMHLERDVAFVIFPRWYLCAVVVVVSRRMRCGWYAPAERIYDRSSTRQAFRCLIARERSFAVANAIPIPISVGESLAAPKLGDDWREHGMVKMPRRDKRKRTKLQMRKTTVVVWP